MEFDYPNDHLFLYLRRWFENFPGDWEKVTELALAAHLASTKCSVPEYVQLLLLERSRVGITSRGYPYGLQVRKLRRRFPDGHSGRGNLLNVERRSAV